MFQYISKIFSKTLAKQTDTILMGRWNRLSCEKQISQRVKQANEDNCGVCIKSIKEKKTTKYLKYEDDYLRVFCM